MYPCMYMQNFHKRKKQSLRTAQAPLHYHYGVLVLYLTYFPLMTATLMPQPNCSGAVEDGTYMSKGLGIFLENREKPAATQD